MPLPSATSKALWLDPFRPLTATDRAQLAAAGLDVLALSTLDEMQAAINAAPASHLAVVLGLGADIELLQDTQALVHSTGRTLPLVCRTERRQLELAVLALHNGACHVLAADDWSEAAWRLAQERATLATAAKNTQEAIPSRPLAPNIGAAVRSVVYVDPVSRNLLALAQRVAQAPVAVLVEGPTGSGKEVLARVLHESSAAANGPFIGLNCAALP